MSKFSEEYASKHEGDGWDIDELLDHYAEEIFKAMDEMLGMWDSPLLNLNRYRELKKRFGVGVEGK